MAGVDPGRLTFRELQWMADQRLRAEWRQTASLIAATFEPHRDRKKRAKPYSADDFDPFAEKRREEPMRISVGQFRALGFERLAMALGEKPEKREVSPGG